MLTIRSSSSGNIVFEFVRCCERGSSEGAIETGGSDFLHEDPNVCGHSTPSHRSDHSARLVSWQSLVGPVAADQVGLDGGHEPVGVGLAGEAPRAFPICRVPASHPPRFAPVMLGLGSLWWAFVDRYWRVVLPTLGIVGSIGAVAVLVAALVLG